MGEKTGLLPIHRHASHAKDLIRRCQLWVVVALSLVTAAVIFFMAGHQHDSEGGR